MNTNPFEGITRPPSPVHSLGEQSTPPAPPAPSVDPVASFFLWFQGHATPEDKIRTLYELIRVLPTALTFDDQPEYMATAAQATKALRDGASKHFDTLKAWLWDYVGHAPKKVQFESGMKFRFAKPVPRTTRKIDWTKFQSEHPDLYAEWVTETVTRPSTGALYL